MADWTAITGIVVSGVVGPATAAAFALLHQARGRRHDREMADLRELRTLLSEASADLREAEGLRGAAAAALVSYGQAIEERAPDAIVRVREAAQKVTLQSERIGLLLGDDHPAAVAHREAVDFITSALTTLLNADVVEGKQAREERVAIRDEEPMRAARARFAAEAHSLVGSRIEPT